jgi:ABC-type molybdate transport system permease subunit
MTQSKQKEHHNKMYKVLAQTFGLVVCLAFLFYLMANIFPELMRGKSDDLLLLIPLILLPVAGYFLTWVREKTGTIMVITGGFLLFTFFLVKGEIMDALIFGLPFMITGLLFGYHIKKRNELKSNK